MCRFLAYLGDSSVVLADLIDHPANSLIKQSRSPRLCQGVNADGFGLAWYQHEIERNPGIYKSTQPAWNDANLRHLTKKIKSTCFLGHVRASTVGEVSFANCHPFVFGEYAFVHNGTIKHIEKYRRRWLAELDQDLFSAIRGQTDSELLFFLILQEMRRSDSMLCAVQQVFEKIKLAQAAEDESAGASEEAYSLLNIALTDGKVLLATCYATKGRAPLSLCYAVAPEVCYGERKRQAGETGLSFDSGAVVIASEALTDYAAEWVNLSAGQGIFVDSNFNVQLIVLS